ncbi:hypothetical protein KIN20_008838 [Parelaphostrongylus tenuis]|uniref:Uncharacterized protein n=1 Tax=Parelaphostrongylus tenuis TaxID=148309 RepID=A0AAD5MAA5_PARTN|nr:hypothetical protein KIN20_008834 [Parelaphostrongylus tenuis]KAJ1352493.1 hypothetical protein KIN20_008838 [Parelaphostrongylus tenuis]
MQVRLVSEVWRPVVSSIEEGVFAETSASSSQEKPSTGKENNRLGKRYKLREV